MIRVAVILALAAFATASVGAGAPETSPRPSARPMPAAELPQIFLVPVGYHPASRPRPRPQAAASVVKVVQVAASRALVLSPRPEARPENLRRRFTVKASGMRTQPSPVLTGKKGSVCGLRAIQGTAMARIPGRIAGCGVAQPVKVTSISGIALSPPAIMDCDTARALNTWVQDGVKPVVGRLGGGVKSLQVAAHYSCRTRNNQPGAKISEHGRGRAVDITAINLNNGVSLSVLKGWRDPAQSKVLKRLHQKACGPFGTVLGPNSDRYHRDHFHLDTAAYRSGAYCR